MAKEVKIMETAYIVTGTLTDQNTVTLDEALPLTPMKVRLSVEPPPASEPTKRTHEEVIAEIWARKKARGHQPRRGGNQPDPDPA